MSDPNIKIRAQDISGGMVSGGGQAVGQGGVINNVTNRPGSPAEQLAAEAGPAPSAAPPPAERVTVGRRIGRTLLSLAQNVLGSWIASFLPGRN